VNLLALPAFLGLFAVSSDFVSAFFTPAWASAAPVLAVLALAGGPHATNYVLTAAINAQGRPDIALRYSLVIMAMRLVASLMAAPYGIPALAWANLAITLCSTLVVLGMARGQLPGAASLAVRAATVPALSAAAMVAGTWGVEVLLAGAAPIALLGAKIALGAVIYAALVLLLAPQALRRLRRGAT